MRYLLTTGVVASGREDRMEIGDTNKRTEIAGLGGQGMQESLVCIWHQLT